MESEQNSQTTKQKLVIVESPTKAKTISRFLGNSYQVIASMGHVRDLPDRKIAVDPDNEFQAIYEVTSSAKNIVTTIKNAAQIASEVYLATDPDREGEAIAWHLLEAAKITKPVQRVVFHSITENAIEEAFAHPREIDMRLVEAQFARRHIDRLIGYPTSNLLRRYVQRGSSAGRVQSPALRMVVERENEIRKFIPVEYWTISADFASTEDKVFTATLVHVNGKAIPKPGLKALDQVNSIKIDLGKSDFKVSSLREKPTKSKPSAPFITTSLQREASNKLRFDPDRTMRIAQQLYEGIELGKETVGLITYMRTDSPQVDPTAIEEARTYIKTRWGEEYIPASNRIHTNRKAQAVAAQEAHEAIRPTSIMRSPDEVQRYLNRDQSKLYELIWNRMVASQMSDESGVTTTVEIQASSTSGASYLLRKSGYVPKFLGFAILYKEESNDSSEEPDSIENVQEILPKLSLDQSMKCVNLSDKQSFTKAPSRYTQASLIKELEENGIGRPSTYASTLSTIIKRNQVAVEERRLAPTPLGEAICRQLQNHLSNLVDYEFTAKLEEDLDEIASGESKYLEIMKRFYIPFNLSLETAKENIERISLTEETDRLCPEGHPMVRRFGKNGYFIACSMYPEHSYIESEEGPLDVETGVICRECGGNIVSKQSRRGSVFWGCSNYPKCRCTLSKKPLIDPCPVCEGILVEGTDGPECVGDCVMKAAVSCPKPDCNGVLLEKRGRFGPFWGCNNYPKCKTIVNKLPLKIACPQCEGLTVSGPKGVAQCYDKECGWKDIPLNDSSGTSLQETSN
ncbi:MAG: type I DNA topoisomerase [SAR202 cluster bacterium]|nr:type I DNA topoisomerase [SAR202 cluster bacterium]